MARIELGDDQIMSDVYTPPAPTAPRTLSETGLSLGFLTDLILKTLFIRGTMRPGQVLRGQGTPAR